jgi:hypothetical protein
LRPSAGRDTTRLVHLEHPGHIVFRHACKMGLEGIVSKRPYPEDLIELRQGARIIEKSKP